MYQPERAAETWKVRIEAVPDAVDEMFIAIPEAAMERLGWKEGDTLAWKVVSDGVFTVEKKHD